MLIQQDSKQAQLKMTEREHDSSLDEEKPLGKRTEKKLIDFILPIRENEKFRTEH